MDGMGFPGASEQYGTASKLHPIGNSMEILRVYSMIRDYCIWVLIDSTKVQIQWVDRFSSVAISGNGLNASARSEYTGRIHSGIREDR